VRSTASATASDRAARRRSRGAALTGLAAALIAAAVGAQTGGRADKQARPSARAKPGAAASAVAPSTATASADYAQRFASSCASCHGANGRNEVPGTPVLAGQHGFYAITQLFLFREGRRANEAMTAVAKTLKDDDLRGFSNFIDTLPPVPAPAPATPTDAERMNRGRALAQEHKCVFCHGTDLAGGQQVPRIGGQHEEYLRASLRGFKSGTRPGYTQAMTEAVSQIPPEDLDTLAYYAARWVATPTPGK
jgi:cytochrome c553